MPRASIPAFRFDEAGTLSRETYPQWACLVQSTAIYADIWQYIDPKQIEVLARLVKPVRSDYHAPGGRMTALELELFRDDRFDYEAKLAEYSPSLVRLLEVRDRMMHPLKDVYLSIVLT